jgi:multidrug efflux pump subunit AcrA (membrane-fusion protein)
MVKIKLPKTRRGRVAAVVVFLIVAAVVAYFVYDAVAEDESAQATYTTGTVQKMTLTSSVSGLGNVEWLQSADVTSSKTGTVRRLRVALGDEVEKNDKLFVIAGTSSSSWVYAPLAGTITALNVENGDVVGSTDGTRAYATVIDLDRLQVAITVAESDSASVQVGQKAVITFDALPELTLTGKVKNIDFSGTNSEGVVSYEVLVTLDATNASVKGGMTVSVDIVTDVATDVLAVPSSAVKTSSSGKYVQVLENGQPTDVSVQVGMATDSYIEIVSGLSEGQEIIVSTTTSGSTTATTTQGGQGGFIIEQNGMPPEGFPSGGGGFAPPGQ